MSLENFWPHFFDKMGRMRDNKDTKDVPNVPGNKTQDGNQANSETADGLDPAVVKALSKMTSNILKLLMKSWAFWPRLFTSMYGGPGR